MDQRCIVSNHFQHCFAFVVGSKVYLWPTILPSNIFLIEERAIARQSDIAEEAFAIHVSITFIQLQSVVENGCYKAVLRFR